METNTRVKQSGSAIVRLLKGDGWENLLTGLGIRNKDKRMSAVPVPGILQEMEVEALYAADDMATKICDYLPEAMVRDWFTLSSKNMSTDQIEDVMGWLDERKVKSKFEQALSWARLYGGSGMILGVKGTDPLSDKALNFTDISELEFITVMQRYELMPNGINGNVSSSNFGMPEWYDLQPRISDSAGLAKSSITNKKIHHTRIIRFDGVMLPQTLFRGNNYWHDSVLSRLINSLRNYNTGNDSVAALLHDFAQAVYKIKDLADIVTAPDGLDVLQRRLDAVDRCRSVLKAVLIGEDEEFERKTTNLTNVDKILDKLGQRLVGSTSMPHTILLGESPSGLGATGDSEKNDWYEYVAAQQEKNLRPQLEYFLKVVFNSKKGPTGGKEPDGWQLQFKPLKQPDQKEILEERKLQAETDEKYINTGVLSPTEVALSRFGQSEYSHETKLSTATPSARAAMMAPPDMGDGEDNTEDNNGEDQGT